MEMIPWIKIESGLILLIRPSATSIPKGIENNRVQKKMISVDPKPDAICEMTVKRLINPP